MEITENKLNEILNKQREEFQGFVATEQRETRHLFGIMKEDLESKIQLIGEQYQDIKATLHSHTKILESHSEILGAHTSVLKSHSETLATHTQMIGSLMEDVQVVKSDVQFLKGALKKKVDYEEFEALAQRVSLLESKIRK